MWGTKVVEATERWRNLQKEELHNLQFLQIFYYERDAVTEDEAWGAGHIEFWFENLKKGDRFEHSGVDDLIWRKFDWLRTWTNGGPFSIR
jgi:hypothetical protein